MPGMSCTISSKFHAMCVLTIPVETLLSKEWSSSSPLRQLLQSSVIKEVVNESMLNIILPNDVLFVPFGYVPLVCAMPQTTDDKSSYGYSNFLVQYIVAPGAAISSQPADVITDIVSTLKKQKIKKRNTLAWKVFCQTYK